MTNTATVANAQLPVEQRSGILYIRRPRGKKLTFMLGGPSFVEAPKMVNWVYVRELGNVIIWIGEDGVQREVVEQTHTATYAPEESMSD